MEISAVMNRIGLIVLWGMALLGAFCSSGCTASGYPGFVKFSPDSERVLYDDGRYGRTYLYWIQTGDKLVFTGRVSCVDAEVRRFVLLPVECDGGRATGSRTDCLLVTVADKGATVTTLPSVPEGGRVAMVFCAEGALLQASTRGYWGAIRQAWTYTTGDSCWEPTSNWYHETDAPPQCFDIPGGALKGGHVFCPLPDRARMPASVEWGRDVEVHSSSDGAMLEFRLPSPDGQYLVRVHDRDDPWLRLTLTDLRNQTKTVLLEKDDFVRDLVDSLIIVVLYPLQPLLPKF